MQIKAEAWDFVGGIDGALTNMLQEGDDDCHTQDALAIWALEKAGAKKV